MKIVGAASAFPRNYYQQEILLGALSRHWAEKLEDQRILARLHSRAQVDGRHLVLPLTEYYGLTRWGDANRACSRPLMNLAEPRYANRLREPVWM